MRAVALRTGPNAAAWGPLAPATTPSCTRARAMRQQPPPTALTATSTPRPHMTTRVHSTCVPLLPRARRVAAEGCRGTRRALPHRRVPIIAVLQLPRRPLPREAGASVDLPQPMRLHEGEKKPMRSRWVRAGAGEGHGDGSSSGSSRERERASAGAVLGSASAAAA
eukprot:4908230-Prymnesium_polylepis.2